MRRVLGGLASKLQAARSERIDVNGFAVHFGVTILVGLEFPVKNGVRFVNLHVAVPTKAQHDFQRRYTDQQADGGQGEILQQAF